ncbi:MAG: glycine C-acetyltransferase [Endozoicomonadaceae bacterium]|nr:glycine C-acetyltransferase [Endozoicomonadaceae bacterium]
MSDAFYSQLATQLDELKHKGLYKEERIIISQQQAEIKVSSGAEVINLCANNYLGLANAPELIEAGKIALDKYGYGMASVRFICGTHAIHKQLEQRLSNFLSMEDTILYSSCFDANGGLFETLLGSEDAIISDALNHASIIDGIRLSKAQRYRYANNDMAKLEACLKEADANGARHKLIATDGVFSMDGIIANLRGICDLADHYGAMVMVDDCHATGFIGDHGRGTHEYHDVIGRVDILTGTLGKALGGASGGYVSGRASLVDWLRNRSRPYLFSNTLCPVIAAASIRVLDMLDAGDDLRQKINDNSRYFRSQMEALGFTLTGKDHPIVPVMIGDAALAKRFADRMLEEGIYVISFSFPVVPDGSARIRTQMSAAHEREHIDKAVAVFAKVGRELGLIS